MTKTRRGKPYIETVDGMVMVDALKFRAIITPVRCSECKRITIYSETFDRRFCPHL